MLFAVGLMQETELYHEYLKQNASKGEIEGFTRPPERVRSGSPMPPEQLQTRGTARATAAHAGCSPEARAREKTQVAGLRH